MPGLETRHTGPRLPVGVRLAAMASQVSPPGRTRPGAHGVCRGAARWGWLWGGSRLLFEDACQVGSGFGVFDDWDGIEF
jgi:hypothetical protein